MLQYPPLSSGRVPRNINEVTAHTIRHSQAVYAYAAYFGKRVEDVSVQNSVRALAADHQARLEYSERVINLKLEEDDFSLNTIDSCLL